MEKCGFAISMPLCSGIAIYAGPGAKLEPLGVKSHARTAQTGFEGPSRSKIRRSVRGALSELWELLGNCWALDRKYIKSEAKGYLGDKTYD